MKTWSSSKIEAVSVSILNEIEEGIIIFDHSLETLFKNRSFSAFSVNEQSVKTLAKKALEEKKDLKNDSFAIFYSRETITCILYKEKELELLLHEWKNPLSIILGYAEVLENIPPAKKYAKEILLAVKRMQKMTFALLSLFSFRNKKEYEEFLLKDLLQECLEEFHLVYPKTNIILDLPETVSLFGDFIQIKQALINLLENAVKYAKSKEPIKIKASTDTKGVYLYVIDRGIGIGEEEKEKIFEKFYMCDKKKSKSLGGTGVGLSLVKKIVENHMGFVEVDSAINEGSTFTLHFPHKKQAESFE